ncbi:MAG: macro domain-containing protein [Bifidobacteriaceae bacterium]|jgi:hypothetical protein|nr:macro domain-containing protein [Bifidobacteriaceae bacterium]
MSFRIVSGVAREADALVVEASEPPPDGTYEVSLVSRLVGGDDAAGRPGLGEASEGGAPGSLVIRVAGPLWRGGGRGQWAVLRQCYVDVLGLAVTHGAQSLAFPLIGTGPGAFPAAEALAVAEAAITDFLSEHDLDVYLAVPDKRALGIGRHMADAVDRYLTARLIPPLSLADLTAEAPHEPGSRRPRGPGRRRAAKRAKASGEEASPAPSAPSGWAELARDGRHPAAHAAPAAYLGPPAAAVAGAAPAAAAEPTGPWATPDEAGGVDAEPLRAPTAPGERTGADGIGRAGGLAAQPVPLGVRAGQVPGPVGEALAALDQPFALTLMKLIDQRGLSDPEVYRRANIDRKHFAKIRANSAYRPSKKTVLSFAVALELDLTETRRLLERAGFALSPALEFDVIVEYFISHQHYNIFEINHTLFYYDQELLAA